MTDDEREAEIRSLRAGPRYGIEWNIDFLLRRLDEARRPPTLAEIRERNRDAIFFRSSLEDI